MRSFSPVLVSILFALGVFFVLALGDKAEGDPCGDANLSANLTNTTEGKLKACKICVDTMWQNSNGTNFTCYYFKSTSSERFECAKASKIGEFSTSWSINEQQCEDTFGPKDNTTTTTPPPTTTTIPTPTSNATTTAPPVTNATTTSTPVPTNATTLAPTTTVSPNITTTIAPGPTPAPSGGSSFSFANFLGGIVFTLAISALAFVGWKFYKARNPNYHTLNTNLI